MADPKVEALRRLAGYKAREKMNPEEENKQTATNMLDRILDYADRPAAAARSAVGAFQEGQDMSDAFMEQLGKPSSEAPTGADIAEKFGESQNIKNPYALGAIATVADVALDPLNLVPGGSARHGMKAAKGIKGMGKGERVLSKVGDIEFPARNQAEAMKVADALKKQKRVPEGSVLTTGERVPVETKEALLRKRPLRKADLPQKEIEDVLEQFPNLRNIKKYGSIE